MRLERLREILEASVPDPWERGFLIGKISINFWSPERRVAIHLLTDRYTEEFMHAIQKKVHEKGGMVIWFPEEMLGTPEEAKAYLRDRLKELSERDRNEGTATSQGMGKD